MCEVWINKENRARHMSIPNIAPINHNTATKARTYKNKTISELSAFTVSHENGQTYTDIKSDL